MRTSEKTDQIDAQMAKVQGELSTVQKNKEVKVEGERAIWKSRYATFAVLYEACHDSLVKHEIAIYQGGSLGANGSERLVTRLAFKGQWVESDFPIKASRDGAQGFAGGVSFAKRWGLCSMVGLVTADDPDEQQGYRDERAAKPSKAKGGQELVLLLDAIRHAKSIEELAPAAVRARSAHSVGEPAATVERAISDWFVNTFGAARNMDEVTLLRDACHRIKPRGTIVHNAIREAEQRLLA